MGHALLLFAVTEGEEASKAPFYLAGGLLAVFAVAVAALGIARHDFPSSAGTARGVIALCATLVVAAMATAVLTS
jgi:hypothetical protein